MTNHYHDEAADAVAAEARDQARGANRLRIILFGGIAIAIASFATVAGVAAASRDKQKPSPAPLDRICLYRIPNGYTVSTFADMSDDTVDAIAARNGIDTLTYEIQADGTIKVVCSEDLAELEVKE